MMPSMENASNFSPLCHYGRAGIAEVTVSAAWFFAEDGAIKSASSPKEERFCLRSLAKPWQFLAVANEGFDPRWLIAVASHSGEGRHQALIEGLCAENSIDLEHSCCPAAFPMDDLRSAQMKAHNQAKQKVLHPCSGKHAHVMLQAEKQRVLDGRTYLSPSHPLQVKIASYVRSQGIVAEWVTDSCGLPTPVMTAANVALLWARLATDESPLVQSLLSHWTHDPYLVGGTNRLDTLITTAGGAKVIAKEGADGLLMVQTLGRAPQSVFLKLAAGYNKAAMGLGLIAILRKYQSQLNPSLKRVYEALLPEMPTWHPDDQPLSWSGI